MITYESAQVGQYEELLQIMEADAASYLPDTLRAMQISRDRFAELFQKVGHVTTIRQDGQLAGFYWIEARGEVLHLHGLILKAAFQGQGIGTQVLEMLVDRWRTQGKVIELGVHQSNEGARRLYQRLGFVDVTFREDVGYFIMQRRLHSPASNRAADTPQAEAERKGKDGQR